MNKNKILALLSQIIKIILQTIIINYQLLFLDYFLGKIQKAMENQTLNPQENMLKTQKKELNIVPEKLDTYSKIISIHVGQAGIQVGNLCWQLFCYEHYIQPDGFRGKTFQPLPKEQLDFANKTFSETEKGKLIPRCIFIDLQPTVIDQIKRGGFRQLYNSDQFISGKEDASNNFSRGYYTLGKHVIEPCIDRIRKMTQNCDSLQGFMMFQSMGGGTGSGLGSLILEKIAMDYGKKCKLNFNIFPSPRLSNTIIDPYNSILATHKLLEHSDASIVLDNDAIFDIYRRNLFFQKPTCKDLNGLISLVISNLTASFRFNGTLNASMSEFKNSLVPLNRFKFLLSSYSPIFSSEACYCCYDNTVKDIIEACIRPDSMMVKCDPRLGKYMACNMMYRGGDISFKLIREAINSINTKKTVQFVDWSLGFQSGVTQQHQAFLPGGDISRWMKNGCMISNSTSISDFFSRINNKFDLMYSKKAFVHWYTQEGMEQGQFIDARQDLAFLEKQYEQINMEESEEEEK